MRFVPREVTISSEPLSRDGAVRRSTLIAGIFRWWSSELGRSMPAALRRAVGLDQDTLLFLLSGTRLEAQLQRGNLTEQLATVALTEDERADPTTALEEAFAGIDPENFRVVLSLDTGLVLRRTIRVPRAAEAEISGVLAFEIERHTPFRADEVYFNHSVDSAASDDNTMSVELVIVPHRIVDPLIRGLRALGLGPDVVTVADFDGSLDSAGNRLPAHGVQERRHSGSTAVKLMAMLVLVLAIAAATTPLLRFTSIANDLAAAVHKAKSDAEATLALRNEADRLTRGAQIVARAKAEAPSPLGVLQTLSELLPDGTWIVQLNVTGSDVVLEGRTDSSADLVGMLEASPMFESVQYLSPVTRDAASGSERFGFSLKLAER